jgi:hypothetical protein
VCVCSLRYPACNAHVPYCHPWPAPLYYTFHIISKRYNFREKVIKLFPKIVPFVFFSLQPSYETFFTDVPCILIPSKFYYQLMHKRTALKGHTPASVSPANFDTIHFISFSKSYCCGAWRNVFHCRPANICSHTTFLAWIFSAAVSSQTHSIAMFSFLA